VSRAIFACALLAASCSLTFDGQPPELPLVNAEPSTPSLPKLNHAPAGTARVMYGYDNTPWAVFAEVMPGDVTPEKGLRLVHLTPPGEDLVFIHPNYFSTWGTFYIFDRDPDSAPNPMTHVSLISPGETVPDAQFEFAGGPYVCVPDDYDTRFLYFVQTMDSKQFFLELRDGSFSRTFDLPDGVDPLNPLGAGSYRFNYNGAFLFVRDGMGKLVVHSTTSLDDWDLGPRPSLFLYDDTSRRVITCGADGVRSVPLDGGGDLVLDPAACDENGSLDFHKNGVIYTQGGTLRFAPEDASAAPSTLLGDKLRFIGFTNDDQIVFSTQSDQEFVNGASDAWLGNWRFMQRGLALSLSRDYKKFRWLESAADPGGIGDLTAAAIPGGAPDQLALNVRQFEELDDGRVLAASNHAFRGTQNRVVVIDEAARTQEWVASSASEYVGIPGSTDLLIDVVSGPSTFDIVRVPLPPKP
jgi:hypothetical protein